jgi:hypothetical protein
MRDLKYYEQKVNNRFGTSAAPPINTAMIPETAQDLALHWRRLPRAEVSVFSDQSRYADLLMSALCDGDYVHLPIHPFEVDRWPGESFVESGTIAVSASYRTVFFEPDAGGLLAELTQAGTPLMMKLHLERPLPGIDGDRRLTREIVEKCVALSPVLQEIMDQSPLGSHCEIVPEFLGLSNDETGVVFRRMPGHHVLPLFALFSPDSELKDYDSHIEQALRQMFGDNARAAADALGELLARPLLQPLFVGFRAGFSLEMHAQNVLFKPGESALIDKVYFRDLEGVVFSNRYRASIGLQPLFEEYQNSELVSDFPTMTRWFNRNVDHDLGRVFTASLNALETCGYFGKRERDRAVQSIRKSARQCVREAGVDRLALPGRVLPISRSPYGNGLGKGHYYRTQYR